MRFIEPRKLTVALGFAAMLFLPLTLGSGVDLASDTHGPLVRTADACAQSFVCGFVPEEPPCPNDPASDCTVGCDGGGGDGGGGGGGGDGDPCLLRC